MIKFENIDVYGIENALRGMRNPMNSWEQSDTRYDNRGNFIVGEKDLKLMHKLYHAGTDHRKFMRQISVWVDITAPLYWWKEFDTYKVGTVSNSCSTMHKIHEKEFTLDDFSHEHLTDKNALISTNTLSCMEHIITCLNWYRKLYLSDKNKSDWWQMIQLLPSSYNQKRTISMNYEVLANMYNARKGHKLDEWQRLREMAESLPYFLEIVQK